MTYRWYGHSHSDPRLTGPAKKRPNGRPAIPIKKMSGDLTLLGMLDETEFENLEEFVQNKMGEAMRFSEASSEPDPAELETDVFAPIQIYSKRYRCRGEAMTPCGRIITCARSATPRRWSEAIARRDAQ